MGACLFARMHICSGRDSTQPEVVSMHVSLQFYAACTEYVNVCSSIAEGDNLRRPIGLHSQETVLGGCQEDDGSSGNS